MAKISLRSYIHEIESLIDTGQIDEAIAHCRQILKVFPKYIEAYRMLGKAYLENQRYGDASDILQRVLSAMPDDFVAHVGMSIVREDEGNLDEAIWHVERAFEVQPANSAVQDELRRLYGKRDGIEPARVRLTRGALARMYVRGDLFQQAIAELRAAQVEDQQRLDLQILLANVYYKIGKRAEAADIANIILHKLPFCIEANRLMAEILVLGDRVEEANTYRQRVNMLDPYNAQISPQASTSEKVPDQAVMLEKLDWRPGQTSMSSQPEWASSLGVEIKDITGAKETPSGLVICSISCFSAHRRNVFKQ